MSRAYRRGRAHGEAREGSVAAVSPRSLQYSAQHGWRTLGFVAADFTSISSFILFYIPLFLVLKTRRGKHD